MRTDAPMILTRLAAAIAVLAAVAAAPVSGAEPQSGEVAISCNNVASGASFQIRIDYSRSTVDTHPAEISAGKISWRDENRWNYTLDRKSGNLTVVLASSTGGSFLYDRCKLEN
jgi:hypothetical protein